MKKYSFIYILILLLSFSSCEEKINIHPENSDEKVVVEAIFCDNPLVSYMRLSKSKGIYESITNHPKITDAIVKVTDETTGDVIDFIYDSSDAKYKSFTTGIPGHVYRLDIDAAGQHITARQTMTSKIDLDRVISVPLDDDPNTYYLKMQFDDPPGQQDFYLFIMQPMDPNAGLEPRFTVLSDLAYDPTERTLSVTDEIFHKNEDWIVLFFHIDIKNYNYLKVILRAMKSLQNGSHPFYGLSLGNPQNTVEGESVLGYFLVSPVSLSPIHIGN